MWQSVGLVHFNGMTLKCFYSRVKSECKEKRHTASSYNILMRRRRAIRRLLGATELTVWSNTLHTHTHTHTHTHRKASSPQNANPIFKAGEREWTRTPTFASHSSPCLRRLIDWYCATESTAVQASRPGDRADPRCLSAVQTPWLFLSIQLEI